MNGLLIRIGIDQEYGNWNAPVDPDTKEFIYIPIPEEQKFRKGFERTYHDFLSSINNFSHRYQKHIYRDLKMPIDLLRKNVHLDPDFQHLTYGDTGKRRGSRITQLKKGDFLAFYSSLKPIETRENKLIYALIGFFTIDEILWAKDIPEHKRHKNAHTRKRDISPTDVIATAKQGVSGRFSHCIPIGEWRERAYRVTRDLLELWGGLSVKNGFIQRSAVPPEFCNPELFLSWLKDQEVKLLQKNNHI